MMEREQKGRFYPPKWQTIKTDHTAAESDTNPVVSTGPAPFETYIEKVFKETEWTSESLPLMKKEWINPLTHETEKAELFQKQYMGVWVTEDGTETKS